MPRMVRIYIRNEALIRAIYISIDSVRYNILYAHKKIIIHQTNGVNTDYRLLLSVKRKRQDLCAQKWFYKNKKNNKICFRKNNKHKY